MTNLQKMLTFFTLSILMVMSIIRAAFMLGTAQGLFVSSVFYVFVLGAIAKKGGKR